MPSPIAIEKVNTEYLTIQNKFVKANLADTLAALQCFTSSVAVWKNELWLLSTLSRWSCGLTVQWLNGPCCWWRNNWGGGTKTVWSYSNKKKVPIFVRASVCTRTGYARVRTEVPRRGRAAWEPGHSAPRVGVLGWLRPMVLHNQPAKSTSSTSDRLMNVWL